MSNYLEKPSSSISKTTSNKSEQNVLISKNKFSDKIEEIATKKTKFLKKMPPPSHISALLTSISMRALVDIVPLATIGLFFSGNHNKAVSNKLNQMVPNGNFKNYAQKTLIAGAVYNIIGKASIYATQNMTSYPLKGIINFLTPAVMTGIASSVALGGNLTKDVKNNIQAFLGSNVGRIVANNLCYNDAIGNTAFAALLAVPIACFPNFHPTTLLSTFTRRLAIRVNGNYGANIAKSIDKRFTKSSNKTNDNQDITKVMPFSSESSRKNSLIFKANIDDEPN